MKIMLTTEFLLSHQVQPDKSLQEFVPMHYIFCGLAFYCSTVDDFHSNAPPVYVFLHGVFHLGSMPINYS